MPIDASIPLGVRPVQMPDQMNALARIMQLKGMQQEGDLNRLKMDEYRSGVESKNRLRSILGQQYEKPEQREEALLGGGFIDEYTKLVKDRREGLTFEGARKEQEIKLFDAALKQRRGLLDQIRTPEEFIAWHQANHADPLIGPKLASMGVTAEKSMAAIQQALSTPGGFERLLQQSALGMEEFIKQNAPKTNVVSAGGTSHVVQIPGLGGAPQTVQTIEHTPTPGDKVRAANEPFTVGPDGKPVPNVPVQDFQIRKATAEQNAKKERWQYDPKRGGRVNLDTGEFQPVTQNGQPIGGEPDKPLTGSSLKLLTEARDNAVTLDRVATTFKDEFASKGVMGLGADASLAVKGVVGSDQGSVQWWKDYRKQVELIERHSLFGSALTPTEQASWRNADIGPGMDAETIKRNLQTRRELSKKLLETTRQDLIDAGQSEARVNAIAGRGPGGAQQPAAGADNDPLGIRGKKP